jgi:hypothetical protein
VLLLKRRMQEWSVIDVSLELGPLQGNVSVAEQSLFFAAMRAILKYGPLRSWIDACTVQLQHLQQIET